ncbi:MAG: hypothetical protein ACSW8G_05315, partial [Bacillota bacterium]
MMRKTVLIMLLAAMAAFAVLVFVEGPKIATEKVRNLNLEQDGFDVSITWDEMDCEGYDLVIVCENQRMDLDLQENQYTIHDVVFDKTYRVTVTARLDSGARSRDAKGRITPKKLKQKPEVSVSEYEGFSKDKFTVKASGKGDISFSSDNEKAASVNGKGVVTLKKPGHAKIRVVASGDYFYRQGERDVDVTVYPDELSRPSLPKVKNVSDSRCTLTWKGTDFAKHYKLYRKNVHTKEFEPYRNVDTEDCSVEITRDNGAYAVKAFAEVGDKTIESPLSQESKVEGTAEKAKSYSSAKNIMTLDSSTLDLVREIHGDGGTNVPQSISNTEDCYVVSYVNHGGSAGKLISYRKTDAECVSIDPCSNMGHANGSTYNPNTNKFYVVKTHKSIRTRSCSTYDGTTKESVETFDLPRVTSGIAYDESNDKFYLS